MPWKNGGGETTEIAVAPEGAGLDAFDWRVSMGRVAVDGPFSSFPGIDRTLTVLEGRGLRLRVGHGPPVELTAGSAPLSFPADVATEAWLLDGPIHDLNVMTRRRCLRHEVAPLAAHGTLRVPVACAAALLFCHLGDVQVATGQGGAELGPLDALHIDEPATHWKVHAENPAALFLIRLLR